MGGTGKTKDGKVVILKIWRNVAVRDIGWTRVRVGGGEASDALAETGIIYRNGEVVPVARTTFYLLDDDVLTITKSGGVQPRPDTLSIYKNVDQALLSDIAHALLASINRSTQTLALIPKGAWATYHCQIHNRFFW